MLTLNQISKVYRVGTFGGKELHAVSKVSFDVQDREVVSLIGESGSGKSTIGKMILRLISTTSGEIRFNGEDVSGLRGGALKEYYRSVQGVFQDPFSSYNPIFKADRVFGVIQDEFFPGVEAAEWNDKINRALEAVGLNPEHVLHKFPHQLSGGQLQRFLIARALLLDIKFLVADEIITHDLSLANYISERAVILYRGCVAEMGATGKIFSGPRHPYTQMLMASVPRLDQKWGKVEMSARAPGPLGGCPYYERCPLADPALGCDRFRPALTEVEAGHFVACYRCEG